MGQVAQWANKEGAGIRFRLEGPAACPGCFPGRENA